MPTPSVDGELLARSLNEELHDVVVPADLATSVIERHRRARRRRQVALGPLAASLAAVAVVLAVVLPTVNHTATTPKAGPRRRRKPFVARDSEPRPHPKFLSNLPEHDHVLCPRPQWCRGHTRRGQDLGRRVRRPDGPGVPVEPCNVHQRQHVRGARMGLEQRTAAVHDNAVVHGNRRRGEDVGDPPGSKSAFVLVPAGHDFFWPAEPLVLDSGNLLRRRYKFLWDRGWCLRYHQQRPDLVCF